MGEAPSDDGVAEPRSGKLEQNPCGIAHTFIATLAKRSNAMIRR
jgi:hypothetical protein